MYHPFFSRSFLTYSRYKEKSLQKKEVFCRIKITTNLLLFLEKEKDEEVIIL